MTSLKEIYISECGQRSCKANSKVVASLPDKADDNGTLRLLDVSQNFVGKNGVGCLLTVARAATKLQTLNLRDNYLDNDTITEVCRVLDGHSSLTSLDLSRNPISHTGGRELSHFVARNRRIVKVELDETHINRALLKIIAQKSEGNLKKLQEEETETSPNSLGGSEYGSRPASGPTEKLAAVNPESPTTTRDVDKPQVEQKPQVEAAPSLPSQKQDEAALLVDTNASGSLAALLCNEGGRVLQFVSSLNCTPTEKNPPPQPGMVPWLGEVCVGSRFLASIFGQDGSETLNHQGTQPIPPHEETDRKAVSSSLQKARKADAPAPEKNDVLHLNFVFQLATQEKVPLPGLQSIWKASQNLPGVIPLPVPKSEVPDAPAEKAVTPRNTTTVTQEDSCPHLDSVLAMASDPQCPNLQALGAARGITPRGDGDPSSSSPPVPSNALQTLIDGSSPREPLAMLGRLLPSSDGRLQGLELMSQVAGPHTVLTHVLETHETVPYNPPVPSLDAVLSTLPLQSSEDPSFSALRTLQSAMRRSQDGAGSTAGSQTATPLKTRSPRTVAPPPHKDEVPDDIPKPDIPSQGPTDRNLSSYSHLKALLRCAGAGASAVERFPWTHVVVEIVSEA